MISFIVIGKNEGWKLIKSIESIYNTIDFNNIESFEIIYVDSNSNDNSVKRVEGFGIEKIIKLTGELNAGIARNVGARYAKGKYLIFIDGDMELRPDFFVNIFSNEHGLIHDFISGNWLNYFYNSTGELINKKKQLEITQDRFEKKTGGFFLINKKLWTSIGGFDELFKTSEDIDLGLRLVKRGTFLLRSKNIAFVHHTIAYLDNNRMWIDFWNLNHLFGRSLLYRKHILNRHVYGRFIRNEYTLIILLIVFLLSFSLPILITSTIIFFYLIVLLIRSKLNFKVLFYYLLRDVTVLFGFFLFFPKKNKYHIEQIK